MIGKGKSISHTRQAVDYVVRKENAEILDKHDISGSNGAEVAKDFNRFQQFNGRCQNHTMSFVISPGINDGQRLTNEKLTEISKEFLQRLQLAKNQHIIVKHVDRKHTHVHIVVNRINHDGKAYDDSYIGFKCQKVADDIAVKHGLVRAKELARQNSMELKLAGREMRKEVSNKIDNVLSKSKPTNFSEFTERLKQVNINVFPTINKQGVMQGYKIGYQGKVWKASEVNKKFTLSRLPFQASPKLTTPSSTIKAEIARQFERKSAKGYLTPNQFKAICEEMKVKLAEKWVDGRRQQIAEYKGKKFHIDHFRDFNKLHQHLRLHFDSLEQRPNLNTHR